MNKILKKIIMGISFILAITTTFCIVSWAEPVDSYLVERTNLIIKAVLNNDLDTFINNSAPFVEGTKNIESKYPQVLWHKKKSELYNRQKQSFIKTKVGPYTPVTEYSSWNLLRSFFKEPCEWRILEQKPLRYSGASVVNVMGVFISIKCKDRKETILRLNYDIYTTKGYLYDVHKVE